MKRRYGNERGIHYSLSFAAFAAFNLFYVFAGQPTWRRIYIAGVQVGPHIISTLAIILSTCSLCAASIAARKRRCRSASPSAWSRAGSGRTRSPPEDLREAFYIIKHKEREREREKEVGLRVYADTIRELLSEGVLTRAELRIIDQVRQQFHISDQDHEKVPGPARDYRPQAL